MGAREFFVFLLDIALLYIGRDTPELLLGCCANSLLVEVYARTAAVLLREQQAHDKLCERRWLYLSGYDVL